MSGYSLDSMKFKLAILNVLAKCPGGRASLDDLRREVETIMASGDQSEPLNHLSALLDVDIFQSGLVLQDDDGLQITTAGLSLLDSLESNSGLFGSFLIIGIARVQTDRHSHRHAGSFKNL